MTAIHQLPTFDRREDDPWWTDDEKKIVDFIYCQLSYSNNQGVVRLVDEKGLTKDDKDYYCWTCIGPDLQEQNGELVFGLDKEWADFLSKHVDIGKYVGTVTYSEMNFDFICHKCGEGIDEDKHDSLIETDPNIWMYDGNGFGRRVQGTVKQTVENKCNCHVCGTECEVAWYDECDIDTLWVFEKGSVLYAHYGRGAGMSFRFHSSLEMNGMEPLEFFKEKKKDVTEVC
ncbi:MAG: hypothetical protein EKK64_10870 [Neisseriaceae bacterium]|nr:MAG: hypothetical protein EKK64_10870 [Neisseriaceae bacterium]